MVLSNLCVKSLNKKFLESRVDTPCRAVLHVEQDIKPQWRSFYENLLKRLEINNRGSYEVQLLIILFVFRCEA